MVLEQRRRGKRGQGGGGMGRHESRQATFRDLRYHDGAQRKLRDHPLRVKVVDVDDGLVVRDILGAWQLGEYVLEAPRVVSLELPGVVEAVQTRRGGRPDPHLEGDRGPEKRN